MESDTGRTGSALRTVLLKFGLPVGVVLIVLYASSPVWFSRALTLLSVGLVLLSAVVLIRSYDRPRRIAAWSLLFSLAASLASFTWYRVAMETRIGGDVMLGLLFAGTLIGLAWSFTVRLQPEGKKVQQRGNVWYLAIWAVVFSFTSLLPVFTGRPPTLAMTVLAFSTGTVVGNNLLLARRVGIVGARARSALE